MSVASLPNPSTPSMVTMNSIVTTTATAAIITATATTSTTTNENETKNHNAVEICSDCCFLSSTSATLAVIWYKLGIDEMSFQALTNML